MVKKLELEFIKANIPEHITGDCPFDNGYRKALKDIRSGNPKGLYTLKQIKDEPRHYKISERFAKGKPEPSL